ncbi:MAG TPA: replication initiator protein A [Longimicrobiaceae bacterium]
MALASRRPVTRSILFDRALESLPLFRLSDSADDGPVQFAPVDGARWRVLPAPGDRLPGTFDQDVYVEILHRYQELGSPADGAVSFTLHAFLRSMGRKADGRTYEQLRAALARLERTTLESAGAYFSAPAGERVDMSFTVLSSVIIERRRVEDHDQLALFPSLTANEPGDARVVLAAPLRANLAAGHVSQVSWARYQQLSSPVARRLYRLLAAHRAELGAAAPNRCRVALERWAEQLPLFQRYPSHLQRVLQPAHEMLVAAGVVREAAILQDGRAWVVEYELPRRA